MFRYIATNLCGKWYIKTAVYANVTGDTVSCTSNTAKIKKGDITQQHIAECQLEYLFQLYLHFFSASSGSSDISLHHRIPATTWRCAQYHAERKWATPKARTFYKSATNNTQHYTRMEYLFQLYLHFTFIFATIKINQPKLSMSFALRYREIGWRVWRCRYYARGGHHWQSELSSLWLCLRLSVFVWSWPALLRSCLLWQPVIHFFRCLLV